MNDHARSCSTQASSLLQSLFGPGQRCEDWRRLCFSFVRIHFLAEISSQEQRGVKMENAKCTKAYSAPLTYIQLYIADLISLRLMRHQL